MNPSLDGVKFDGNGLVPCIVQDGGTGEVLMLAYMNQESLQKTLETGETHFWSRSRKELWHKGATSGHIQHVRRILFDCDADALLVQVDQEGVACHTGERTCFHNVGYEREGVSKPMSDLLAHLTQTIRQRHKELPEGSYTTYLFQSGVDKILKKVGEEATEVVIAAKNRNQDELAWEASDLLYHLMVLFEEQGMPLTAVAAELEKRMDKKGKGGLTK